MTRGLLFIALLFCLPGWALTREQALKALEESYLAGLRGQGPPGFLDPRIENHYFALYMTALSGTVTAGSLQAEDLQMLAQDLSRKYGFRFSLTEYPFAQAADLKNIVNIGRERAAVQNAFKQQLVAQLTEARDTYPIPAIQIKMTPQFTSAQLPRTLAALPSQERSVHLSQSGGDDKVILALELLAQSPSGRALVETVLPDLKSGRLVIQAMGPNDRAKHVAAILRSGPGAKPGELGMTLLLHPEASVGRLALDLAHELTHATDPNWLRHAAYNVQIGGEMRALREKGDAASAARYQELANQRAQANAASTAQLEPPAFQRQLNIREELEARYPESVPFFDALTQRNQLDAKIVTSEYLSERYGIQSADIVACQAAVSGVNPH